MRLDPLGHQEVGGNGKPAPFGHFCDSLGERSHRGAHNGWVRALEGPHDEALANVGDHGFGDRHIPKLTLNVIGGLRVPNFEDGVDGFHKHGIAIFAEVAKHLGI